MHSTKADRDQFVKTLTEQLQTQTKEWLIQRLCEFAVDDPLNSDRIFLYLSTEKPDEDEVIRDFKFTIDKAIKQIKDHGPADWRNKLPRRALYDIEDALTKLSLQGKPNVVLNIAEYTLLGLDSISGLQDECELDWLISRFRTLHAGACCEIKLDPEHFGTHLAELANKTNWWIFDGPPKEAGPPKEYAEFLGPAGLASYASARNKKVVRSA